MHGAEFSTTAFCGPTPDLSRSTTYRPRNAEIGPSLFKLSIGSATWKTPSSRYGAVEAIRCSSCPSSDADHRLRCLREGVAPWQRNDTGLGDSYAAFSNKRLTRSASSSCRFGQRQRADAAAPLASTAQRERAHRRSRLFYAARPAFPLYPRSAIHAPSFTSASYAGWTRSPSRPPYPPSRRRLLPRSPLRSPAGAYAAAAVLPSPIASPV